MGSTTSPGASHDTLSYSTTPNAQQSSCLVYFITGNPGLIGYYEPFLSTLASLLSDSAVGYEISGTSLAGFEALSSDQDSTSSELGPPPYSLRQQIEITERRIAALARRHAQSVSGGGLPPVILIGHSVGAYILLQVLRRHCQREPRHLRIIGGILLFPTVTHIAKSPSGVRLTVGILFHTSPHQLISPQPFLRLPSLAPSISIIVRGLLFLLPDAALRGLVRLVTGFPEHAISSTVVFLRSKTGVLQSLYVSISPSPMVQANLLDTWAEMRCYPSQKIVGMRRFGEQP